MIIALWVCVKPEGMYFTGHPEPYCWQVSLLGEFAPLTIVAHHPHFIYSFACN